MVDARADIQIHSTIFPFFSKQKNCSQACKEGSKSSNSSLVEASLAIVHQESSVMLRLLAVASPSATIFKFMDCVEIVLYVDKLLGVRY